MSHEEDIERSTDSAPQRAWEPRQRSEADLKDALHRFCDAAWNRESRVSIFTIPVDLERDADIILSDGITELLALREHTQRMRRALSLAKSIILSGERMSTQAEQEIDAALDFTLPREAGA